MRYVTRPDTAGPLAQVRLPNRAVVDKPDMAVARCTSRVVQAFCKPHQILELSDEARRTFLAHQTFLNIKGNTAAQMGKENLATRMSIAPWHLGMLCFEMLVCAAPCCKVVSGGSLCLSCAVREWIQVAMIGASKSTHARAQSECFAM